MQLLLHIYAVENSLEQYPGEVISVSEAQKIKERLGIPIKDVSIESVNIGPGSDLFTLLITIANSLFSLPTVIRNGIKDWKWLIDILKGWIRKKDIVALDVDAAGLLAIDYLAEKYGATNDLDIIEYHTFKIVDLSWALPAQEKPSTLSHNYYVMTFKVGGSVLVLSVRSTGEIRELERFDDMPYGLNDV